MCYNNLCSINGARRPELKFYIRKKDMKKRIIAAIVATVMTVLSLVSCGAGFSFVNEDLNGYVTFDETAFKEALAKIEIEDGDFTTDETVRQQKVIDDLYASLTAAMIKAVGDEDKLTSGVPSARDVIYFCYYCVDEATGDVYYTSQMNDSTVTASSTKAKHVIQLADFDDEDELQAAIAEAVLAAIEAGREVSKYEMDATKGTVVNTKTEEGKTPDKVMVSYKVQYELPAVDEETGEPILDDEGQPTYDSFTKVVKYEELDLGGSDPLAVFLRGDKVTMSVGNNAYVTEGEGDAAVKKYSFAVTEDVGENTGVTCTYSEFNVQWIIEEKPAEAFVAVKHTPYSTVNKVEPDNAHNSNATNDLNDVELTYYIYPTYYVSVPELDATTIIKNIVGADVSTSTVELFESEEYKNGDETIKALVETLDKLWAEDEDTLKAAKVTVGSEEKTLSDLKKAYDDAAAAVKAAGDNATEEQEKAETDTKKAYDDALDAEIDKQIAKILASTSTAEGAKVASEVVLEQYKELTYDGLKDAYDNDIIEKVGTAVWELIDKYGAILAYPEDLVEEFVDHLYEGYENDFYTGDKDSSTTNYDHYGDLDTFLKDKVGDDIDAGLKKEAEAAIAPMLKIYAAAKALEDDAVIALPTYVDADIAAGVYDADYEDNADLSDKENAKKRAEAEEDAEESKTTAKEDATKFLITDKVFKEYKKNVGKATYRVWEEQYGERNIRLALQCNRLFYYLLATDIQKNDDGDMELVYADVTVDDVTTKVISFRTLSYSIKAEAED